MLAFSGQDSFLDTNFTMNSGNFSKFNITMRNQKDLDVLCSGSGLGNTTVCNKAALGISLSTPILMLSTGVLGNILALLVLYTSKKEMKNTKFFPLLLGLAWTDLIGQLCTGPIAIIVYANNLKWVGGEALCTYHGFVMVWFGLLTPLIACCMSLERFIALRFAYFYARFAKRTMAQYIIVGCWISTCLMCTLPLMGFGSYEHQFPGSWCFLNFHRESDLDTAYASIFGLLNIIFIGVMIVCNVTVVVTLIKMRKSRKIKHSPSVERRFSVIPKSLLQMEIETQMAWFLCAITVVFSICWLPLNVHIMINQITGKTDYAKDLIGVRLASINQILDPWLYILLRKAMFFKILRRVKHYVLSRKSDVVTNKSARHPTKGNTQNCSHVKNMTVENPVNKSPKLNNTVNWDNTAKSMSHNCDRDVLPCDRLPKTPLKECGDSELDVFIDSQKCDKNNACSDQYERSYYHSCDEKTNSPSKPRAKRIRSVPS